MSTLPGHTREDYLEFLVRAREKGHCSVYNAAREDGYDPSVNWAELAKDEA